MKKILVVLLILLPVCAFAQEETRYPWILTIFGGGASLCTEDGCFGPRGPAFGASFGRSMTDRWSFELEGTYAWTSENELPLVDLDTGIVYTPVLDRTRVWGGGHFLGKIAKFGDASDFFISLGAVGAFERQTEKVPEGIFATPTKDIGIKGGLAGGAGVNFWFSDNWGVRPEIRYYLVASPLSGIRYTAGLMHKF
ncbi:MAG TPA: hypothetical protein VLR94_12035 [Acidobacteriota bacterium]|nr:hypothetical protein [Acidobacteriota bacterium]